MGIAAYNRGSRCISRGLGTLVEPTAKSTPRPAEWGETARAKAIDRARRLIAGCERYGVPVVRETLIDAVAAAERCARSTAEAAVDLVLAEKSP